MNAALRRQQVVELALKGVVPKTIAARMDKGVETIYADLKWARSQGIDIPLFTTSKPNGEHKPLPAKLVPFEPKASTVTVSRPLFKLLSEKAEKAGKTPSELAAKILQDGLILGGLGHE